MGSPVPAVLNGPAFHTGFPAYTMSGPMTYSVYKLKLTNGVIIAAVVMGEMVGETYTYSWVRRNDGARVPVDQIVGWQDDSVCADYAAAIAQYVRNPVSIVVRGDWGHALGRHIANSTDAKVTCVACARAYVRASVAQCGQVPEGWEEFAQ